MWAKPISSDEQSEKKGGNVTIYNRKINEGEKKKLSFIVPVLMRLIEWVESVPFLAFHVIWVLNIMARPIQRGKEFVFV